MDFHFSRNETIFVHSSAIDSHGTEIDAYHYFAPNVRDYLSYLRRIEDLVIPDLKVERISLSKLNDNRSPQRLCFDTIYSPAEYQDVAIICTPDVSIEFLEDEIRFSPMRFLPLKTHKPRDPFLPGGTNALFTFFDFYVDNHYID